MEFELSIKIKRAPLDVFIFFRDKDKYPQEEGSPVLVLDQITPGLPGVGTRYREVVQILPFAQAEIWSEITRFEPPEYLEEDFHSTGMVGHLAYYFQPDGSGTTLYQRQIFIYEGLLKLLIPIIRIALSRRLKQRLEAIKQILESGWSVVPPD